MKLRVFLGVLYAVRLRGLDETLSKLRQRKLGFQGELSCSIGG